MYYCCSCDEKLWKRFCAETTTEINLLAENWKYILGGLICQVCMYIFILAFINFFLIVLLSALLRLKLWAICFVLANLFEMNVVKLDFL